METITLPENVPIIHFKFNKCLNKVKLLKSDWASR